MTDLKADLDTALRHGVAQQRRYRMHDPRERLLLFAAAAFWAMLGDARLATHLETLLHDIQEQALAPAPPGQP